MSKLILLRHGESTFNKLNLFTGWLNVGLSENGIAEALSAGKELQSTNIDLIFTSTLMRSLQTAMILMTRHSSNKAAIVASEHNHKQNIQKTEVPDNSMPIIADWRFNERHYGSLQGMNKQAAVEKYGKEQVALWRRSFATPPPQGESLEMTMERTLPALKEIVIPELIKDKDVLIVAHGNSLRSIIMHIENIAPENITQLEIVTGKPMYYKFDTHSHKFSPEAR